MFWTLLLLDCSRCHICSVLGFSGGSDSKESACNAGDLSSVPGWGRSPGEGNGYPFQYSYLENLTDRGAWRATVHGVAKSLTRLSNQLGLRGVADLALKIDRFWKFGINIYTLIYLKWVMYMYSSIPSLFTTANQLYPNIK